jgi:hypothetical protein
MKPSQKNITIEEGRGPKMKSTFICLASLGFEMHPKRQIMQFTHTPKHSQQKYNRQQDKQQKLKPRLPTQTVPE